MRFNPPEYSIPGIDIYPSPTYRGRWECHFRGRKGQHMKQYIRETFGDQDDMVYTTGDIDSSVHDDCGALITDHQLSWLILGAK
jgi:hypothetical protein